MTVYDEVPYPSLSHSQSHPDTLATLARLLGLHPAPLERCRVFEIGCASGGNLIPMAQGLPGSTFVGIDLSGRQVAEGQAAIAALGLNNITLRQLDILGVTADFGEFDYIVAHGIYSWVPPHVQEKLLDICRQNLAPHGVAYVSYNTYPGWHVFGMIREMMLYHTRGIADARERAAQARGLLDFLAESVPASDNNRGSLTHAYSGFLKRELERLGPKADAFMLHDELEEVNDPVYLHQFVERAARHGLQYVAEVEFRSVLPSHFQPEVSETLFKMARDSVEMEQYMDFLRNRSFRQSLLCHRDVQINRVIAPERLMGFHVAARAVPLSDQPDLQGVSVEKFKGQDGATLSIDHPVSKAAMLHLAEIWPRSVTFDALLTAARDRLNGAGTGKEREREKEREGEGEAASDDQVLAANLLKAYVYSENLVELHVYAPPFTLQVSERPVASPWARWQARDWNKVTNLRHERVDLDSLSRFLLARLDGAHDCDDLLQALLAGPVASGDVVAQQDGEAVNDPDLARQVLAGEVQRSLRWLARAALLVG